MILTKHRQDPFNQLDDLYKQSIDSDNEQILSNIICQSKKIPNLTNMFNTLDLIYKLIIYKLTIKNDDPDEIISEINIDDILIELMEDNESNDNQFTKIDLSCFNFKGIKVKNIFHLWKVFVQFYFDMKDI